MSSQNLRPPLRMRDVAVAVQLELPVGPGGEPVVVVAVQHDRRVRPDPGLGQELAEVLATGDVAPDPVGQLAGPVPADGTREVALLVGRRVDVDLDEADLRVGQVGERPVAVDEGGVAGVSVAHGVGFLRDGSRSPGRWLRGRSEDQPPDVSRSRRLNSASRSVHAPASALRLANDPRVDPARVLDRDRRPVRSVLDDDPGAVAVVGHPVGLELERDVGDDRRAEQPVEVRGVEPIGDVGDPDRPPALEPGQQVDHPDGRERVAGLGDRRRVDDRIRQSGRRRAQRAQADGEDGGLGHGVGHLRLNSLGIGRSLPPDPCRVTTGRQANEASPVGPPGLNRSGACFMLPGRASGGRVAPRESVDRQHDTSTMPPMDPDSIPTEPIIDPGPLDATAVAPGPSQASGSPTAGRGRGTAIRRVAIGLALALTFSVGIGVGRLVPSVEGGADTTTPNPTGHPTSAQELALIDQAWDILHDQYVGKDQLDDQALAYGAINGLTEAVGDTGHTSFLTPEERAARADELSGSYVGIGVRIDTADGRAAGHRPGVQGQPGREGRAQGGRRADRGRRQVDRRPRPRRGRRLGSRTRPGRRSGSRSGAARRAPSGRSASSARPSPRWSCRGRWCRARRPRSCVSTSSRTAPPTTSRRHSARSRRPGPSG